MKTPPNSRNVLLRAVRGIAVSAAIAIPFNSASAGGVFYQYFSQYFFPNYSNYNKPTTNNNNHLTTNNYNKPTTNYYNKPVSNHFNKPSPSKYIVVWSGDQVVDQPGRAPDPDFIAIIDADPKSSQYGKVVNTAVMADIPGEHLLAETENFVDNALDAAGVPSPAVANDGDILVPNLSSALLNEAHHFNAEHVVDPVTGHHYIYPGGLISANVFGCDITDPLNVKPVPGTLIEPGVKYNESRHKDIQRYNNVCGLAVSATKVTAFSGTDDMFVLPNGNIIATYMGAKGSAYDPANVSNVGAMPTISPTLPPTLTTPGGLVEFDRFGTLIGQYSAVPSEPVPGAGVFPNGQKMLGPKRYAKRSMIIMGGVDENGDPSHPLGLGADTGLADTGLLAHPHGIDFRADLRGKKLKDGELNQVNGILMTSDYADPVSVALSGNMGKGFHKQTQASGSTIRLWDMANLAEGPYAVVQMPDGPRVEHVPVHEEPEGLMALAMTKKHNGGFVASMSGGALYYSSDLTKANPEFRLVYDFGPSTGASVFRVTADDNYVILPLAGVQSKIASVDRNNPLVNRDYRGEHTPRVVLLDIRKLIRAGNNYKCDAAPASAFDSSGDLNGDGVPETFSHATGAPVTVGTIGKFQPNNGAADCPKIVSKVRMGTKQGHRDNLLTHGGPHFVLESGKFVATSQYFVDLREFAIPGIAEFLEVNNVQRANDPLYENFPGWSAGFDQNALPGVGSIGDDTVCMLKRTKGKLVRDKRFNKSEKGKPHGCVDLDFGDKGKKWPSRGTRAADAGNATPHALTFIDLNEVAKDIRKSSQGY